MARTAEQVARIKQRIEAIPVDARALIKKALDKSADELIDLQRRSVAEDEGDLKRSIRKEAGDHDLAVRVTAGGPMTTRPVRQGKSAIYDYALAIEHGTSTRPAQPFFYPSYRLLRRRIKNRLARAVRAAVKKTVADL